MQVLDLCKGWVVENLIKLLRYLFQNILLSLGKFLIKEVTMNIFNILINNVLQFFVPVPA